MKKVTSSTNGLRSHRKLLLAKRSEILSGSRSKLETLVGQGPGAAEDLAPVFHDQFIALGISRLDHLQLQQIDMALNRMGSADYGFCQDCGDPISPKRIEALPWAIRCIACQEHLSSIQDSAQLAELAA